MDENESFDFLNFLDSQNLLGGHSCLINSQSGLWEYIVDEIMATNGRRRLYLPRDGTKPCKTSSAAWKASLRMNDSFDDWLKRARSSDKHFPMFEKIRNVAGYDTGVWSSYERKSEKSRWSATWQDLLNLC